MHASMNSTSINQSLTTGLYNPHTITADSIIPKEQNSPNNISSIPQDTLQKALSFLTIRELLNKRRVHKSWHTDINKHINNRPEFIKINLTRYLKDFSLKALKSTIRNFAKIQFLNRDILPFQDYKRVMPHDAETFCRIIAQNAYKIDNHPEVPKQIHLDLHNNASTKIYLQTLPYLSALTGLILSYNRLEPENIARITWKFPHLEKLVLAYIDSVSWRSIEKLRKLKILEISNHSLTDEDLATLLEKFSNLETLELTCGGLISLAYLEASKKLKRLILNYNRLNDQAIKNLSSKFPHLEELDLSHNYITSLQNLSRLEKLKVLKLSFLKLHEQNLKYIAPNCPNLEELDLSYNQLRSLSLLGKLPKLKRLKLIGNNLSNEDLAYISQNYPNLEELELAYTGITSLKFLGKLEKLKTFKLSENELSNKDVAYIRKSCPNLQQIALKNSNIDPEYFTKNPLLANVKIIPH